MTLEQQAREDRRFARIVKQFNEAAAAFDASIEEYRREERNREAALPLRHPDGPQEHGPATAAQVIGRDPKARYNPLPQKECDSARQTEALRF